MRTKVTEKLTNALTLFQRDDDALNRALWCLQCIGEEMLDPGCKQARDSGSIGNKACPWFLTPRYKRMKSLSRVQECFDLDC